MRLVHVLLIVLLSLQAGLVDAHVCAELSGPASQGQLVTGPALVANQAMQVSMPDLCGGCCSVCQELPTADELAAMALILPGCADVLNSTNTRLAQRNFADRHERPQWMVA